MNKEDKHVCGTISKGHVWDIYKTRNVKYVHACQRAFEGTYVTSTQRKKSKHKFLNPDWALWGYLGGTAKGMELL